MKRFILSVLLGVFLLGVFSCGVDEPAVPELESIEFTNLDGNRLVMHPNQTIYVRYELVPEELDDLVELTWRSSKKQVVSVEDGYVTAHKEGSAEITAIYGNVSASFDVEVVPWEVADFTIPESLEISVGDVVQVEVTNIQPEDAPVSAISWSVSSTTCAECYVENDQLYLQAKKEGAVKLYGRAGDVSKSCEVTIVENIPLESLSVTLDYESISIGETTVARVILEPSNATGVDIEWSFSPEGIVNATIDEATNSVTLEGVEVGTVTITATDIEGITAQATLEVTEPQVRSISVAIVDGFQSSQVMVALSPDGSVSEYNKSAAMTVTTEPAGLESQLTWVSNNESAAVVENGVIVSKGHGYAQIKAVAPNGVESDILYVMSLTQSGADWKWTENYQDFDDLSVYTSPSSVYTAAGYIDMAMVDFNLKPVDGRVLSFISWFKVKGIETSTEFELSPYAGEQYVTNFLITTLSPTAGSVKVNPPYGNPVTFNAEFGVKSFTLMAVYDEDYIYKTVAKDGTMTLSLSDFDWEVFEIYLNSRTSYAETPGYASKLTWMEDYTVSPKLESNSELYLRLDAFKPGTTYTFTYTPDDTRDWGSPSFKIKVVE